MLATHEQRTDPSGCFGAADCTGTADLRELDPAMRDRPQRASSFETSFAPTPAVSLACGERPNEFAGDARLTTPQFDRLVRRREIVELGNKSDASRTVAKPPRRAM